MKLALNGNRPGTTQCSVQQTWIREEFSEKLYFQSARPTRADGDAMSPRGTCLAPGERSEESYTRSKVHTTQTAQIAPCWRRGRYPDFRRVLYLEVLGGGSSLISPLGALSGVSGVCARHPLLIHRRKESGVLPYNWYCVLRSYQVITRQRPTATDPTRVQLHHLTCQIKKTHGVEHAGGRSR